MNLMIIGIIGVIYSKLPKPIANASLINAQEKILYQLVNKKTIKKN